MIKRVLKVSTLGDILLHINDIPNCQRGGYTLYVPSEQEQLSEFTPCAVLFTPSTASVAYLPTFARRYQFEQLADDWLVRDVVEYVRSNREDITARHLVMSLNYYLANDKYLNTASFDG